MVIKEGFKFLDDDLGILRKEALEEDKRSAVRSMEERWNAIKTWKTDGKIECTKSGRVKVEDSSNPSKVFWNLI